MDVGMSAFRDETLGADGDASAGGSLHVEGCLTG